MPESHVAAVLLAAGGSTRFGRPKQLLEWEGRPLVAHVADVAWMAGLQPVVVVLGAGAEEITPALDGRPVQVLTNYRWAEGMSGSLALGVAALPLAVEAAVFLQVDQPLITPQLLQALVARWRESGAGIVVPTVAGRRGSPVLFAREFFPALAHLSGDVGGRALFAAHANRLAELPVADPLLLADADTPETFARLQAAHRDPTAALRGIRAVISDMDGVLWQGTAPLPGLAEFFDFLHGHDLRYVLVTNNSTRTPGHTVEKLARFGITTTAEHVLTAAEATADYVAGQWPGALVYVIGEPPLLDNLQARGLRLSPGDAAEIVVVGWDRQFSWEKLATATRLIHGGAHFVGTNPDRTFPTETGLVHGNGAQLAALEAATGVAPLMIGKPEPLLYQYALARLGATPHETLVIGDRPDTDVLGGLRLGMLTAFVRCGVTSEAALARFPIHPDLVVDDLGDLTRQWQTLIDV